MSIFMKKSGVMFLTLFCSVVFNLSFANDLPKIACTLTDQLAPDGSPGDAKDSFTHTTPMIYLICDSDEIKKGQQVKAAWIAVDTKNLAPANYKIAEKNFDVNQDIPDGKTYTMDFSLSKPTNGWPVGDYRVDLYVGDSLSQSLKFNVK